MREVPLGEVEVFVDGLDSPEGIAVGRDGTVYGGGQRGEVYRISPDGRKVEVFAHLGEGQGGFGCAFHRGGDLYIVSSGLVRGVLKVTPEGRVSLFADRSPDGPFCGPNFPVFDYDGNLWLSDSGDWFKFTGKLYRIRPDGTVDVMLRGLCFPNGLAVPASGDAVFIIQSNADNVLRAQIKPDGTMGDLEVYCQGIHTVPDGMAFDADGNLIVTAFWGHALYAVPAEPAPPGSDMPGRWPGRIVGDPDRRVLNFPTNCAFGGSEFDQVFVADVGVRHIGRFKWDRPGQKLYGHL